MTGDGFLNLLKPPGMSSAEAVSRVKRLLPRGTKVGHCGTLDPDAAGVLPISVGRATRLFDYFLDKDKAYVALMTLGVSTDTQDASGQIVRVRPVTAGEAEVRAALPAFVGDIMQRPPAYSALKRDGRPLYELAREGKAVEAEPRRAHVEAIEYLGAEGASSHRLRVTCGRGVYIRTLCHDIGEALGCGAHMSFLLRERAGVFLARDAVTPEELAEDTLLTPMDAPLLHLPEARVQASQRRTAQNGNPMIPLSPVPAGVPVRVYVGEAFAGVAVAGEDGLLRFRAMLLA